MPNDEQNQNFNQENPKQTEVTPPDPHTGDPIPEEVRTGGEHHNAGQVVDHNNKANHPNPNPNVQNQARQEERNRNQGTSR